MNEVPESLISFRRRQLHANPELSGREKGTADTVVRFLKEQHPDKLITGLGGHGIAAIYKGRLPGKTVLMRCELDALPITEINDFEYRSNVPGVSHKCGHDGHTAILCGLAMALKDNRPAKGRVVLLFQPAEENGEGADAILAEERFSEIEPDFVFALHNLPGYPAGQVLVKDGNFTAAVNSIILKLDGKTSHAGEPEQGVNPALAISEILMQSDLLNYNHPSSPDFALVTPVYVTLGEKAYGISAGHGEIHLTLRSWSAEKRRELESSISSIAGKVCADHSLRLKVEFTESFMPNINHPAAAQIIRKAATSAGLELKEAADPFRWGEDFGSFTGRYPGAMFGLGAGEDCPALHNPDYDFPDEILGPGISMFTHVINAALDE